MFLYIFRDFTNNFVSNIDNLLYIMSSPTSGGYGCNENRSKGGNTTITNIIKLKKVGTNNILDR